MGLALDAAIFADALNRQLLLADGKPGTREQRLAAMTRAFEIWPKLCRRMAEIELAVPDVSELGYDADERLMFAIAKMKADQAAAETTKPAASG